MASTFYAKKLTSLSAPLLLLIVATTCVAQISDHPIITEVFNDPVGNDGPVGRNMANPHQEYIEIYLPPASALSPALNRDALRLTFYEIEGDVDSSGPGLVNYRIDLPTFDLDASNGITPGAIPRPSSGVVVMGWIDYVGNPPTGLAGTPSSRVALINGGITSTTGYTFVALNGGQFDGTTNFPIPTAISYINMPSEASSGIIQNGSAVYLLVNRDAAGYVSLTDDADPAGGNHNPSLPGNGVLGTSCLLDGWGCNDHPSFVITQQPTGDSNVDNWINLPPGGAYSTLVCQLPERSDVPALIGDATGYARKFIDVRRTTEDGIAGNENPVSDAVNIYRSTRNSGPFYPTPGRIVQTTTAPELGVAAAAEQAFSVLAGTSGHPALLAANVGGNYAINLNVSAGTSSNPAAATFQNGSSVIGIPGQTLAFPPFGITAAMSAAAGATATATMTVNATNTNGADPSVVAPIQNVQATATVLKPTTGQNAAGQPFQATVYAAIQPLVSQPASNEFASTSLAAWVGPRLGNQAQQTWGHASFLLNPATNISDPTLVRPLIQNFPDPNNYINPSGPPGRLDLVQTVLQSAEVLSGASTYDEIFDATHTALRGIRVGLPGTTTFNGTFTPSEPLYFYDATGHPPAVRSALFNATTTRTFEVALLETNVRFDGSLEPGDTDDVGILVQALDVEASSPVVTGEFVFLSFMGGLQGADLDGTNVLPGVSIVANIIYLDLDNLHEVLGIRSIGPIWLIDAGGANNEIEPLEMFSLNPVNAGPAPCPGDLNGDHQVSLADLATLLANFGTPSGATAAQGDMDGDTDVDLSDLAAFLARFGTVCP